MLNTHKMLMLLAILLSAAVSAPASAADGAAAESSPETADAILERVADQPAPEASAVRMQMTLISMRGGKSYEQERSVEIFAQQGDEQEGSKSLLRFTAPSDVEGVSLLVLENKEGPNEQFLYMPALKQDPKRISGGQKNASFLGTDFTFADLEGRNPDEWNHELLGDEAVDGRAAWKIESTPKEGVETQYDKLIQWIGKDQLLPVKVEFYDRNGLLKVLTVQEIKTIDGYKIATKTRMENVVKKHATVLEIEEQKNDLEIPPSVFTTREMKRR